MPLPEFTIKHYAGKVTYQVQVPGLYNHRGLEEPADSAVRQLDN